jgi:thiol-disulfide isomerase/thioredoxin
MRCLAVAVLLATLVHRADAVPLSAPVKLVAGGAAPQFVRQDVQGHRVDLNAFHGKLVLLDFWASWCAPCIVEIPHLIDLQRRYGLQKFQVIGISMDDSPAALREAMNHFAFNYPVVLGDATFGMLYGGVFGLPKRFLIGPDGKILEIWNGELAPSVLERSLTVALKGH